MEQMERSGGAMSMQREDTGGLRESIKDLVKRLYCIDAVFGKVGSGDRLDLFVWIQEHTEEAYEQLEEFEYSIRQKYPKGCVVSWAHQGRDYSESPADYFNSYFVR